MDTASRRPWEASSPVSPPQTQTLPSIQTLTQDVDRRSKDQSTPLSSTLSAPRDSGNWSAHSGLSGPQGNSMPFLNQPTNTSPPGAYSSEANGQSSAFSPNHSAHPSNASGPGDRGSGDFDDSRRGSVDSRIHQGFRNMDLGPTSPYNASANASQSSLVQGLNRERGILTNGYRGPRSSTGSGGGNHMSPSWPRTTGSGGFVAGRVAPPIQANPKPDVAFTERPFPGQAWAFPDPDAPTNKPASSFSRRGSFAESLTSSIYSDRSRLPPGQQELPGETHHHSLQHRQVETLRGDPDSPNSTTPYSRTPELRVTHKLAERKRRSEMKDCFEQLRAKLPSNQNNKSSKWETLARAIDYISSLEGQVKTHRMESDKQRHQIHDLEIQMKDLAQQVQRMQHGGSFNSQSSLPPNQHAYGHSQNYANGNDSSKEPPRTLPPIINGAMQGVQYGSEERR